MESAGSPSPVDALDVETDACPEPLSWRQVLERFRTESTSWALDRGHYTLRGRCWGEGPPLYFLCGIGGTCELYALLVWLLREDFRCVVWDYPGTDSGAEVMPGATAADLAMDLCAIADELNDEQVNLYATSFGAFVAWEAMLCGGERIGQAVVQGGFAHRELSRFERWMVVACQHLPGKMRHVPGYRTIQRQNHRRWFPPFDESRWEFLLSDTGRIPICSVANRAAMVHNRDLRPRLGEVQANLLLLHSEGESKQSHREMESQLPHARTEFLHTSGHLPYLTHPHRTAKILREFLLSAESDAQATSESKQAPSL